MFELTAEQREQLARRRTEFDAFFRELMPVLVEFCSDLELPSPHEVLNDPSPFVPLIAHWLEAQDLKSACRDDRAWLSVRLGYLIGEYFTRRYFGCWFVDDNPTSKWFSQYVVGQFSRYPHARIAPVQMAMNLVETSGDLSAYLAEASAAIEAS